MREIIIDVTKIKGKKKEDYVIAGGISGGKVVTEKNKIPELVIPVKILAFSCSADTYSNAFWVKDNETHMALPEFDDKIRFFFLTE